jgi:hypothetical protein
MTETQLTNELCKALEDVGAYVKAHVASAMNPSGWPDRWLCHRLWHGHIEFKLGTSLTPLQAKRIKEVNRRQPGTAFVVRFAEGGLRIEGADGMMLSEVPGGDPMALLKALADLQMYSRKAE